MTQIDPQIRPCTPELLPQVAALLRHLWPTDVETSLRVLRWKYCENPYRAQVPGVVALRDDQVVGFRGYFATAWRTPGASGSVRILSPGDTCVRPDCRRWGLSVAMGRLASQLFAADFPLFLNTTTTRASLPGYRKLGFQPLAPKTYVSVYRSVDLARYLLAYAQRPAQGAVGGRCRDEGDFVVTREPRAEEMAALADRVRRPWPGLAPLRTAEYFRWRFRNPARTYVFHHAYAGGGLRAYVALGLSPNSRRGYLLDCLDADETALTGLLARIIEARDLDILSIATASLGSTAVDWRALGFQAAGVLRHLERRRTGELPLLVRPVAADFEERHWQVGGLEARDLGNWQYRDMVSDAF